MSERETMVSEPGVDDIIAPFCGFINERPALLSLLYDIDMLPEQTVTRAGAYRLVALCEVWKAGEDGTLPKPSGPSRAALAKSRETKT